MGEITEPTSRERIDYTKSKVLSASRWIVLSGTATFFLTEVLKMTSELQLPSWAVLIIYIVVNTLLYASAKFIEGENS
jgi:membrane protein DedA with SNARE-associated domain